MTLGYLLLRMHEVCSCGGKMSAIMVVRDFFLLEKETGKKFWPIIGNYDKTRINIGHQHDR